MNTGKILFLNKNEVKKIISPAEALKLTEVALQEYARGSTINPIKLSMSIHPYHDGHINSMPSYMQLGDIAGVKIVSVYNNNSQKYGLPTTLGTIILYDSETGLPVCIMDGTQITDLRTGAVSGINAKYFARKDSNSLAVIGAGMQGYTSMQMTLSTLSGIQDVIVCDLDESRCKRFIKLASEEFPKHRFSMCSDHRQALMQTDVVIYATSAPRPLLNNVDVIKPGSTVICVCELLTRRAVSLFDMWYVDFAECALDRYNDGGRHSAKMYGDTWEDLTEELITGEIGKVTVGEVPGRKNDQQRILASAVGMSVEDVIIAKEVYDTAVSEKIGKILDFQCL